jgi:hypothetical protein
VVLRIYAGRAGRGIGVAGDRVDVTAGRDVLTGEINAVGMAGEVDEMLHDVMASRKKVQNAEGIIWCDSAYNIF